MAWEVNGTPDTLGSAGPDVEITDLTAKIFNQFLAHNLVSTTAAQDLTYNSDSGSLYASRKSLNGTTDITAVSQALVDLRFNSNEDYFQVINSLWVSGEEKTSISYMVSNNTDGAGNAPNRGEFAFKYVPSPLTDTINAVKLDKGAFTNYAADTNLSALGTD